MNQDKLSQYLREFLFESKGRNALLYEEASKFVRSLKRDYANKEIAYNYYLGFGYYEDNKLIPFLRPYLPFKFNIQGHSSFNYNFYIQKFDSNGDVSDIYYKFGDSPFERVKLKKPLDLFGHFLNKKDEVSYDTLLKYGLHFSFHFISEETRGLGERFEYLLNNTKNTGDDLVRDEELYKQEINKPYKECWTEDYIDDVTGEVKSIRRCEYRLPGGKDFRYKDFNI